MVRQKPTPKQLPGDLVQNWRQPWRRNLQHQLNHLFSFVLSSQCVDHCCITMATMERGFDCICLYLAIIFFYFRFTRILNDKINHVLNQYDYSMFHEHPNAGAKCTKMQLFVKMRRTDRACINWVKTCFNSGNSGRFKEVMASRWVKEQHLDKLWGVGWYQHNMVCPRRSLRWKMFCWGCASCKHHPCGGARVLFFVKCWVFETQRAGTENCWACCTWHWEKKHNFHAL